MGRHSQSPRTPRKLNRLASAMMLVSALAWPMLPLTAQAQTISAADSRQAFNIPAQSLNSALLTFADITGVQVFFNAARVQQLRSSPVQGSLTLDEALTRLLSGTGLGWQRTANGSITLQEIQDSADDNIQLAPVRVTGSTGTSVEMAGAGTINLVTREELNRFPVTSTSDIFRGIPGVTAANARNGASFDVNIRGVQGDRVKVLVDGTQSTSNTSKSYGGENNHNYVDPDLISSISVEKGPTTGPYGAGTGGGVVRLSTLTAQDLITDGGNWGLRLRGGWANNSSDGKGFMDYTNTNPLPRETPGNNWSGSLAGAWTGMDDKLELVYAHSRRQQGNYLAGRRGPTSWTLQVTPTIALDRPYSLYGPNAEVFNTSQETFSTLLKARANLPQDHWLELSFNQLDTEFGESRVTSYNYNIEQKALGTAKKDTWLLRHGWNPADSTFWNVRSNVWQVDVDESHPEIVYSEETSNTRTRGLESWNTSTFDVAGMNTSLSYGAALQQEKTEGMGITEPRGERDMSSVFLQGSIWLTKWLNLEASARHEAYTTTGTGSFVSPVPGQDRIPYKVNDGHERLNPTLGINIMPLESLTLYARYSEGWRPPTPKETGLTYGIDRNVLQPEITESTEIGITLDFNHLLRESDVLKVQLAWFDNAHEDYMIRLLGDSNSPYYYSNIDKAVFSGVEFSLNYDTGWAFANYGMNHYSKAEFCGGPQPGCVQDFNDGGFNVLLGLVSPPKQTHSMTLGVRVLDRRLTLGARGNIVSKPLGKITDQNSGAKLEGGWIDHEVYDVFGDFRVTKNLDLGVAVENVRDSYYTEAMTSPATAIPAPGRTTKAHFTYRF